MNEWKRQHPAAIFISFLSNLRQMIISLVAIFIFGQSAGSTNPIFYLVFVAMILFFSIGSGVIGWWKFYYSLEANELRIKQGLIFRKNRFIRKDRIQSIDINAKLLQRLFGLVEVRIETAGGGHEPEFRIVALKREEAVNIKRELLRKTSEKLLDDEMNSTHGQLDDENDRNQVEEYSSHSIEHLREAQQSWESVDEELQSERAPDYQWNLGVRRLIIAALTSSGVGIAATFIAAIVSQVPQFLPEWMLDQVIGWFIQSSISLLGMMAVFVLFAAWLFTLIGTLLKYGMFKLEKREDDIHISRGVLEKRQLTLNAKRITALRIVQSPIRQPFKYVSVYVESAGGGTKEEDLSTILIPLCKRDEVESIIKQIIPEFSFRPTYQPLPKKSLRRYMIKLIIPALLLAGAFIYFVPYGWLTLILPILGASIGYFQFRSAGISQANNFLYLRTRIISKTEVYLPRKRIQDLQCSQHILQKLDHLYTIQVPVLTSMIGKTFSLRHISQEQAEQASRWYSYEMNSEI